MQTTSSHYDRRTNLLNALIAALRKNDDPEGIIRYKAPDSGRTVNRPFDIMHPDKAPANDAACNYAPTLRIGMDLYIKLGDQPGEREGALLLWFQGGNTMIRAKDIKTAAAYVRKVILRHHSQPLTLSRHIAPAKAPRQRKARVVASCTALAAPTTHDAKPILPTAYQVGTFHKANLKAFWKRNATGTFRIAIAYQDSDDFFLVEPVLWNRMRNIGVHAALKERTAATQGKQHICTEACVTLP